MTLKTVTSKIRKIEKVLKTKFGVAELYVFGSIAQGKGKQNSDLDLLVEFSSKEIGIFEFLELKEYLETELSCQVDLVTRDAIKHWMRSAIEENSIRVA